MTRETGTRLALRNQTRLEALYEGLVPRLAPKIDYVIHSLVATGGGM